MPNKYNMEYATQIFTHRVQPYANILFPSPIQDIQCDNVSTEEPNQAYLNTGNGNHRNVDEQIEALLLQELNIVWLIARFFGWTVDDDANRGMTSA